MSYFLNTNTTVKGSISKSKSSNLDSKLDSKLISVRFVKSSNQNSKYNQIRHFSNVLNIDKNSFDYAIYKDNINKLKSLL